MCSPNTLFLALHDQGRIYSKQGLFRKNVGLLTWAAGPIFPGKNWRPFLFFSHHRTCVSCQFPWKTGDLFWSSVSLLLIALVHSGIATIISGMQKKCRLPLLLWGPFLWGPLFCRTCWTCLNPPLYMTVDSRDNCNFSSKCCTMRYTSNSCSTMEQCFVSSPTVFR